MDVYEKFGKRNPVYIKNQELLKRLSDPTDKEIGRAMCNRCEGVFGHSGHIRQLFCCNSCYESLEDERFFMGRIRRGY